MEGVISPEEFRKLQTQVDILQRFLIKTFGSSFLEFCKDAQKQLSQPAKGKPPPPLSNNKAVSNSNGTTGVKSEGVTKGVTSSASSAPKSALKRPPPPLLHRPTLTPNSAKQEVTIVAGSTEISRVINASVNGGEEGDHEEYYEDENEEDEVEILPPETVFSDEDISTKNSDFNRDSSQLSYRRQDLKRNHATAFEEYDESELMEDPNVNLPAGTDCIVIESDDEHEQPENYEEYNDASYEDVNNEGEIYDESLNYTDESIQLQVTGNYQTEDVQTDGNVTFGTLVTAADTGIQYFQCTFCPSAKIFKHKQSLKEHYLLNHSPTPPAFQCQCGRRFLKLSQLKRHEVVHTAERPFVCPICHKDFTRKDNMTVHMVRNHAEKKHPCPYCPDKIYATPAEVNRHLRLYHSQWKQ